MKQFLFAAAVFLLGVFAGTFWANILLGSQIDTLHIENMQLREDLLKTEKQVQQLTANPKKSVVSKIDTFVEFSDSGSFDDFEKSVIELAIVKNIREWLKPLYGQDVAEVNYLLIPGIINRDLFIDQTAVRLFLKMVVISETISVWVEAQPKSEG